jgi:nucleoside-diphosphate-sugar epimerase
LKLLVFGCGYAGLAIALAARDAGFAVTATFRSPESTKAHQGIRVIHFDAADAAIAEATHIVATAAPDENGDPVLFRYASPLAAAKGLRWLGYLSTTGVYGNRDGGWVDEDSAPAPQSARAQRRVDAETAWQKYQNVAVDIFRLAGIYGPGRSMLDDLREGTARRVVKPGHLFGRIHRDDIARGVVTAMLQNPPPAIRIFNFSDDEPAASADVVEEAARLLGIEPPAPVSFAEAALKMSPMGLSFWAENRRVANSKTKAVLNLNWKYPSYREGLRAILAEELKQAITE